MKMATSLNEANLEKRLLTVTNTQESIQTLSLWCLHHKSHSKKIIDIWMKVLKKVKISHRLALFYLANDVIQNGKRKGCAQFAEMWMPVIKNAVGLVRDEKIRPQIERILTIWNDRNIFDAQYISELHAVLGKATTSKVQAVVNAKILAEFKPQKLVDKIKKFKRLENEVEMKHKQFSGLKMDVCSSETLKQLKDKAHGTKFTKEFEDATTKLEELIHMLQREVKERVALLELLEQSEVFYETQKKEAKIVANAYKNFGARVKNLQTKLQELMPNLPSPVPTPTLDAPSPVDSSPSQSPNKDECKDEKMNVRVKESKSNKGSVDDSKDNTEAVDMEMSDEDCDSAGKEEPSVVVDVPSPGSAPSPEGSPVGLNLSPPAVVHKPHSKETTPALTKAFSAAMQIPTVTKRATASSLFGNIASGGTQAKTSASSLDIRLSNLMQNIPNFTTNFFGGRPLEAINSLHGPNSASGGHGEGCSTPVKDEESATGSATPLQDENREARSDSQRVFEPCGDDGVAGSSALHDEVVDSPRVLHGYISHCGDGLNRLTLSPPLPASAVARVIDSCFDGEISACTDGMNESMDCKERWVTWSGDDQANYSSQPAKDGNATPTIGDILQKLVSSGTVHNLNSQPSSSGVQPWSVQPLQPSQTWFNQSPPSQAAKVKPLPPPPAPLFGNLVPTIPLPSGDQPFPDPVAAESVLTTSPSYPYDPPSNSAAGVLPGFPPSSLTAETGEPGSKSRNPKPAQVYRRNSNIVELTPSPVATPSFDGSNDACNNHNLITLVQNCESENPGVKDGQLVAPETNFPPAMKNRTAGTPLRYAGPPLVGANRAMVTGNLRAVSGNANNNNGDGQPYMNMEKTTENCGPSNLRTIVPQAPYGRDHRSPEAKAETAPVVDAGVLGPVGAQTSYSKIETLDSRRDSGNTWSPGLGNMFPPPRDEPLPSGWKPMPQIASAPFRREAPPYGPVRGFSFQRRGIRRDWHPPPGPPPKRMMLGPNIMRPPRWSSNPPPY